MRQYKIGFTAGNFDLLHPDLRILGEDYLGKPFTGDDLPIEVLYTSRAHDWSTTKLKDLITKQTIKQNPSLLDEKNKG